MQTITLKVNGLYTSPNPFSSAPEGGLLVADDVSIDQPNLATSRRGFIEQSLLPLSSDRITRFDDYQGSSDSQAYMVGTWSNGKFGYLNAGTWTAFSGTYNNPNDVLARCRFLQANRNLYVTSADGIYKTSSIENDTPRLAGGPAGLDLQLSFNISANQWFGWNPQGIFTASTTNTSQTLTIPGTITIPAVAIGSYISGTGIQTGTTITGITQPSVAAQTTVATTTVGATTVTVGSATGIVIGQFVQDYSGNTFATGTTVTNVVGTTVTLSSPVRLTNASTIGVSFTSPGSLTMSLAATATSSAVTVTYGFGSQVAYRLLWGYVDGNGNRTVGTPTQWVSITNTSAGTGTVTAVSTVPAGLTTAYFYELYRASQTATDSVTPTDEMQLVFEGSLTSTDISNGYVTITDIQPDSQRGQTLYTSPSVGGISNAYGRPPFCVDICTFYGYTFFAAPTLPHTLLLSILGVGAPNGVQTGDVLTIGGIAYTGAVAENIATNSFQVYSAGSVAQNITNTANSLMRVVNRSVTSTLYAYGISGPSDLPGQMKFTVRTPGGAQFVAIASAHGSAYAPALPTAGTTITSTAVSYPNGIMASVLNQPEAAPLAGTQGGLLPLVGSASSPIRRILPLRDRVAVLKDDGAFFIVGTSFQNFTVLPIDYTTIITAPDSAVVLNNEVWALATTGIVAISDSGVKAESFQNINDVITKLYGSAYATVRQFAFGIAYQSDHKYIICLPSTVGDAGNTQTYVYNIFTDTWVRWTRQTSAGFVNPADNLLYLGKSTSNQIVNERKSGSFTDYVDESSGTTTLVSASGTTITLASLSGINLGDLLYQDSSHASPILAINTTNFTVTVRDLLTWTPSSTVTIYPSIHSILQWKPQVAQNPGMLRQYSEGDILFTVARFSNAKVSFFTEISQAYTDVPLQSTASTPWGGFIWGGPGIPWGDVSRPKPVRFLVPGEDQICTQINVSYSSQEAWANWAVVGLNLVYSPLGEELIG